MKQRIQYLESKVGQQIYSGDSDEEDGRTDRRGSTATSRAAAARQRRFKTSNRIDNLYFGTPSLANVVQDVRWPKTSGTRLLLTILSSHTSNWALNP